METEEVIIFTDEGRHIFNEKIIPNWKENRRKHLSYLVEKNTELYFTSQILENVNRIIFKLLSKLSEYTKLRTISLKYMDSDFYPAFYRLLHEKDNFVYLILTKDKDFFHLINKNTFLYVDEFLDFENLKLKLSQKYQVNNESLLNLFALFFPVFHVLIGDKSDNIKPLVEHKGIKYWLKIFAEKIRDDFKAKIPELFKHPKWKLYNIILTSDFLFKYLNLKERENYKKEFFKRLIIFDFDLISLIILRVKHKDIYDKLNLDKTVSNVVENLYNVYVDNEVYRMLHSNTYVLNSKNSGSDNFEIVYEFLKKLNINFPMEFVSIDLSDFAKRLC